MTLMYIEELTLGQSAESRKIVTDPTDYAYYTAPDRPSGTHFPQVFAIPGDDFIPVPVSGCFDRTMAQQIVAFIDSLHHPTAHYRMVVHCE